MTLCVLFRQLYEKFNSIYEVSQDVGHLVIPSLEMETKVFEWLANAATALEDVASQVKHMTGGGEPPVCILHMYTYYNVFLTFSLFLMNEDF